MSSPQWVFWLRAEFDHDANTHIDVDERAQVRQRAETISSRLYSERSCGVDEAVVIDKPSTGMSFINADRHPAVPGSAFRLLSLANIACAALCGECVDSLRLV